MNRTFAFERSWGAEILPGGQARFRLWAPGQPAMFLADETGNAKFEMSRAEDGWFDLTTERIQAGSSYRFELTDRTRIPDPAARCQAGDDVHGPSKLVDPRSYEWRTGDWSSRPWHEAVIYELHTGTFSEEGTFRGVEAKLDYLAKLGVTAIELMPVAQFGGTRGWGYDGVLLYAPHMAYGGPDGLKGLVDAAHERGLMVLLDVVYNHFGPDGNYLHLYAPQFFNPQRHTPWGAAIDYAQPAVRRFFIENALYWLEEYRLDGLRLDAIDQIDDPSSPSILQELAATVRATITGRHIHLTTEDNRNVTELHEWEETGAPRLYTAEWNDDLHHVAHVLATGETDGYYVDYQEDPAALLARALATGYIYQGETSPFLDGSPRGKPSALLPPLAFVDFLQNHDQIGNRAFGERLSVLAPPNAIDALTAILLLSPHVPLLFMGEEWGETNPFLFFTDFHGELGDAVREGRRNEFGRWQSFRDAHSRAEIPDPNALSTFSASKLDWAAANTGERLNFVKQLLALRQQELAPRLNGVGGYAAIKQESESRALHVAWRLGDGSEYSLIANLSETPYPLPLSWQTQNGSGALGDGSVLLEHPSGAAAELSNGTLPAWSTVYTIRATNRPGQAAR